jgi:hypothetical protein
MVRPRAFGFNPGTSPTNPFQSPPTLSSGEIEVRAAAEFDALVGALLDAGVEVLLVEDRPDPRMPDAVFPNNWISTHHDGTVVLYPMLAPLRRGERREDVVELLARRFQVRRVVDLSPNEDEGRFLEGTGSLVFDHRHRRVYAGLSPRTDPGMLCEIGELLDYDTVVFRANVASGEAVYHTNVVMTIGEGFALVCAEAIGDPGERDRVLGSLRSAGREVVPITRAQMGSFAANILELQSGDGEAVVAASGAAWNALLTPQRALIESLARIVSVPIPTIEAVGGGSVRCMIAEIFLSRASKSGVG